MPTTPTPEPASPVASATPSVRPVVTDDQVEQIAAEIYDEFEPDFFYDRPEDVRARYCEVMANAMRRAGIEVSR